MTIFPSTSRFQVALCAFLSFLVPLLVFLPAVRFELIDLDDISYITSNGLATAPLTFGNIRNAFVSRGPANLHVPAVWISYMLDIAVFGNHPWAFHLSNILWHALDSLLLFFFLKRLANHFSRTPASASVLLLLALLWALHPLRVESVAWATERKDTLSLFFGLLVLHSWLSVLTSRHAIPKLAFAGSALLAYALGLCAKPSLVTLPAILFVLSIPPCRERPRWQIILPALLPFLAMALFSSRATTAIHDAFNHIVPPPLCDRLATVPSVFLFYVAKTICLRHLAVIYGKWTSPLWLGILLALPLLALGVWIFLKRRSFPLLWLGALTAAAFFVPVSGIVPIPFNLVADRYAYLPALGLSIALLQLFASSGESAAGAPAPESPGLFRRFPLRLAILLAACTACAMATARYLPSWRSTATVYLPARRHVPDHPAIRAFDAKIARSHGDFATARNCWLRAGTQSDNYELLLAGATDVYALEGPEAAIRYLEAIPPPPVYLPGWSARVASARIALGQYDEALDTVLHALPATPPADSLRNHLLHAAMIAAWHLGRPADSLQYARQSGLLPPGVPQVSPHHFLSYYLVLWNNDERPHALDYFRQIVRDFPDPGVFNNIAWILATPFYSPAPPSEAVALARRAVAATPPASPLRPVFLDTLSVALANAGDFPGAIEAVSDAIALLPPDSPSLPAMQRRLGLYRQSLPYRELADKPVPPAQYAYSPPP